MSRRQRSAQEQTKRARVAREKTLRRRARTRRAATAAAAAVTLAGAGSAAASPAAASTGVPATAALLDCSGATTPGSSPGNLTDVDGTMFFTASDARGTALWRSNGSAGGTVLLKRLESDGYDYDYGSNMVGVDGTLFFTVGGDDDNSELWRSDGTRAGTVLVKRFSAGGGEYGGGGPENLTAVGDTLFFTASDDVHGEELWRSNGTRAGTVLVKDISPGGDSGGYDEYDYGPTNLTAVGETLFFTADDGIRGHEVWRSDGTKAGTVLVKNIRPGSYGSYPGRLTAVGDTLFFRARDGVHGRELWRSDGTAAGTVLVEDIRPGGASADPEGLVGVGDTLFFSTEDGTSGRDLWVSDGTAAGTVLVKDFPSSGDEYEEYGLSEIVAVGDTAFFAADDGSHGLELWSSDGSEAGTVMVKDIRLGDYLSYPASLTPVGDTLLFIARDGVHGQELWRSDGTTAGTSLVEDILPNGASSRPRELTESGGDLFFRADDGLHGDELWRSDGTEAGTSMVVDINKGGAFYVTTRASYNAENGTLRVWAAFEGSGTVGVVPVREGGIRPLEREISGSDTVRLNLHLVLTRAAKRTLRRTGQVEVGARFTFESCGGAVRSITRHYTVKMR
ncbi:ELWxxDGT repeat protein [Nocardioides bizhenqiangii]|uniref:ELWxxDGT repeat protein n=1 Tax=Nocardioides bizhenqiangii TaxID=3095076 RepID=A0ABZ0ZMR5_9ACTN|nr:ELWxxDGT repeat protein [Nocardioides sp. HM61]WQQ25646.1 ELWxxDGT repeat protein [Nocardioides sp. HM61]